MNDIDRLGELRAEISNLQAAAKKIEDRIKARGPGNFEGLMFRATVSTVDTDRTDWKTIAAKLHPSRQLVTAHTKTVHSTRLTVTARQKNAA